MTKKKGFILDLNDLESLFTGKANENHCHPNHRSERCYCDGKDRDYQSCPAYQRIAAISPHLRRLNAESQKELRRGINAHVDAVVICPLLQYRVSDVLKGKYWLSYTPSPDKV